MLSRVNNAFSRQVVLCFCKPGSRLIRATDDPSLLEARTPPFRSTPDRRRSEAGRSSAAAIVGVAVGALHAEKTLPARWRDALLGRFGTDEDGRVQALLQLAVERFAG
jgi:hypothetical protein